MKTKGQLPLAIALCCLSALCYTLNDSITKFLIDRYDVTVIIFVRSLIALPILALLPFLSGQKPIGRSEGLALHALRGLLGLCAAWLYILGLRSLSVAEATVLVFASPLLITLASALWLRERVTRWQWAAVLTSFGGVIIALQPGLAPLSGDAILVLLSAVLYAAVALLARWLPKGENFWQVSFYGAFFACLFVAPFALRHNVVPASADLWLFTAASMTSAFGIGFGSIAYRMAAASDLAPFGNSSLLWSVLVTFAFWGVVPGVWTLAGMAIIIASAGFHYAARAPKAP